MSKQKTSPVPDVPMPLFDKDVLEQLSRTLSLAEQDILSALQFLASASVFSVAILLQLCLDLGQTSLSWQANMKANLIAHLLENTAPTMVGLTSSQSKQIKKLESAFYTLYPELFLGVVNVG